MFDDLSSTIYVDDNGLIYFCGDDLYGHYTREEFINLFLALSSRILQVIKEAK